MRKVLKIKGVFKQKVEMRLNEDVIGIIVRFTGDLGVVEVLKGYMNGKMYESFYLKNHKKLIYGEVQSGKTAKIIEELRLAKSIKFPSILVIQNSILVLKQYISRLKQESIEFQVIENETKKIEKPVIILMNNKHRYEKYKSLPNIPEKYKLILDESDMTINHKLMESALIEVHITATPFINKYKNYFDEIEHIEKPIEYKGIDKVAVREVMELGEPPFDHKYDYESVVKEFTNTERGMLLINDMNTIDKMKECAKNLSKIFPIPIILLSSDKSVFIRGEEKKIGIDNISKILDKYDNKNHIVIIANRLSNRGLSYTNSTYTRHLTHQLSYIKKYEGNFKHNKSSLASLTYFLQRCRVFGKYTDEEPINLYLSSHIIPRFEDYKEYISNWNQIKETLLKKPTDVYEKSSIFNCYSCIDI